MIASYMNNNLCIAETGNSGGDRALMLHTLLEIGEGLLAMGADVHRVEKTLAYMGKAYGAVRMDVFVITTSIVVTMCYEDGTADTQSRRISKSGTDFLNLEQLNAISRKYCEAPFDTQTLLDSVLEVKKQRKPCWPVLAGNLLASASFTIFFGGTVLDGLMSSVFAVLVWAMQNWMTGICKNKVVFNFLASFVTGLGICVLGKFLPMLHTDKIIIGDIMLLIPGLAFTNSVKDIFVGDTISGVMRLVETVLWAAAIAIGFVLATRIMGGAL